MLIPSYPNYELIDNKIIKQNKELKAIYVGKGRYVYKMKHESGTWKRVALRTIKNLISPKLVLPEDAKPIKGTNNKYWVDTLGNVYSFSHMNLQGKKLKPSIIPDKYLTVVINGKQVTIHSIVANTFIMEDYASKGLCCLHADDDKHNPRLDNLSVGTYSQNNKDAYSRGRNPGNGLHKL